MGQMGEAVPPDDIGRIRARHGGSRKRDGAVLVVGGLGNQVGTSLDADWLGRSGPWRGVAGRPPDSGAWPRTAEARNDSRDRVTNAPRLGCVGNSEVAFIYPPTEAPAGTGRRARQQVRLGERSIDTTGGAGGKAVGRNPIVVSEMGGDGRQQ